MNHSGDAAEQIVRISLEGIDYAIRCDTFPYKHYSTYKKFVGA